MHGKGDMHGKRGVCMVKGSMCDKGGGVVTGEMATATDGTHYTGMHSCFSLSEFPNRNLPIKSKLIFRTI